MFKNLYLSFIFEKDIFVEVLALQIKLKVIVTLLFCYFLNGSVLFITEMFS